MVSSATTEIEILLKFGDYEYMRALFDRGVVYMNSLEYFRTLEANDERPDVNEGSVRISNRHGGVLKWKNPMTGAIQHIALLTHSTVRELHSNIQNINVYCLYYLKATVPLVSIGARIAHRTQTGFGDYAVVVADAGDFVTRIKQAAMDKGYRHFRSLVRYEDLSESDVTVGPFVKDQRFSHQSEIRIAVTTGANDSSPVQLEIGSLEDIAVMVPIAELDDISLAV